ncbi:DNA (cytosine-5)-methyltransferase 1 [Cohaesibacter sp. ES.047]|uniref:DNA cytosine methyltransferase n=1 Tax=Cohaesibacter sp. ES.047 TaxID=1798205 RepID=UPI000BB8EE63|nr:DNA cytosine methyltransferase [Cohaesibacter sp. ES.047]SNY91412.1 DNA (cytosine-5)-methyltransferase 1 [Cohaesibacter sp. ES.047]
MALCPTRNPEINPFNGLSLCSGFGGLELGLHVAQPEYRTVCYVEQEAFAAATLVARMEDQALDHAPVWSNVKSFDGRPWRGKVHILTAGYPCQPFSASGLQKGKKDPRHLWPEVARIIRECSPEWVFCENVEGHLDRGFDEVALELQSMGFTVKAGLFSAAEVGASHLRRRLFILAHANNCAERQPGRVSDVQGEGVADCSGNRSSWLSDWDSQLCSHLDNSLDPDTSSGHGPERIEPLPIFAPAPCDFETWKRILTRREDLQPEFFGLDDGLANRMERTRAAGNGVVSLAAAYAYVSLRAAFEG